jgi:hypothetical protein
MTQPMPIYLDFWADQPPVPATCPVAHPAATGSQSWVMAGGFASYPTAIPEGSTPLRPDVAHMFRIYDPADPREIMWVTDTRAAPTWVVTRAAEGSTPVSHQAGFEIRPFITKASLDGRQRGSPNGLMLRPQLTSAPVEWTDAGQHDLARITIPAMEAFRGGAQYEIQAWGYYTAAGTTSISFGLARDNPNVNLGTLAHTITGAAGLPQWRIFAAFNSHGANTAQSVMAWVGNNGNQATPIPAYLFGDMTEVPFAGSNDTVFRLWASKAGAATMVLLGARAGRAA